MQKLHLPLLVRGVEAPGVPWPWQNLRGAELVGNPSSQGGSCRWTGRAPTWRPAPVPRRLVGSGGSSGHVFPLSLELGTNSRKTCEAANGIMEKVFIYFSKEACEDRGRLNMRPRRREVSPLLTGIKQIAWNEGVSRAGAGGRGWPGAPKVRSPRREQGWTQGLKALLDGVGGFMLRAFLHTCFLPCLPKVQAPRGHRIGLLP